MTSAAYDTETARTVKDELRDHDGEWYPVEDLVERVALLTARNEDAVEATVEELRRCGEIYGPMDKGLKVTP